MSKRTFAVSANAVRANTLVERLQQTFVDSLSQISSQQGDGSPFVPAEWTRADGLCGGGVRYMATDKTLFNRASVNVSQIHYTDLPEKALDSATALSTIVHPQNPHAPSMHMHISWTEMKGGKGYWRIMADLNPSIPLQNATDSFTANLKEAAQAQYEEASTQGDRYFHIPALDRHRGVSHFYLENYCTADAEADYALAESVGKSVIRCYSQLLAEAVETNPKPSEQDSRQQLEYHTLYLFQVLTLDRGTTSGLLVHNQNDVGILGSLPSHVDRDLLASWKQKVESPQDKLIEAIVEVLPVVSPCPIDDNVKQALANCVRNHYQAYPQALEFQARGTVIPPTVQNHN